MNPEVRNLIAGMIGELHALYRDHEPWEVEQRLSAVESFLGQLRSDFASEATRTRPAARYQDDSRSASMDSVREVPELVSTDSEPSLTDRLLRHLSNASSVRIASAFLSASDTNPMIQPLQRLTARGVPVRVLTSVMNFFNSPDALSAFVSWSGSLELRLYHEHPSAPAELLTGRSRGFHAKTMLIEKKIQPNVVAVGSANLTGGGAGTNVEWNYLTDFEVNVALDGASSGYQRAVELFDTLWEGRSYVPDEDFLERYREIWSRARVIHRELQTIGIPNRDDAETESNNGIPRRVPNPAQHAALARLKELREAGVHRCAIIAATGVGKTILSAFDVGNAGARRVLFLAHRRTILDHARAEYQLVLGDRYTYTIVQGRESIESLSDGQVVAFAMVQTLGREAALEALPRDFFDYIVVDEFHHAAAETYQRVLDYFEPQYVLGMTATPERTDGQDVLALCDRNVAYEVRLLEAVDRGWLIPFQYFAIYDPTDYSQISWTGSGYDEEELEIALSGDTRADLVANNLRMYQSDSGERRVVAFCSNVGHARWMSRAFSVRGLPAQALTGETLQSERDAMIERLEDPDDPLEIICTVDVLSEGVDIPSITHVLMLRPTHSFTVFLQQLGRGLRHHPGKRFVVVLDFVGNYRKSYVAPLALNGYHTVPETGARSLVSTFRPPKGCFISADTEVERIWRDELFSGNREARMLRRILDSLKELGESDETSTRRSTGEVRLPELFVLSAERDDADDLSASIRKLGGWLVVRDKLELITAAERRLIGTPAAMFLIHVEQELKAQTSYKMAVLHCLLDLTEEAVDARYSTVPTSWTVVEIAPRFLQYYLTDRRRIADWKDLDRSPNPEAYPLTKVASKLKSMPLHHMSNDDVKPFLLDDDTFQLKGAFIPFWRDAAFRELVRERVEYAEARYWHRTWITREPTEQA